MLSKLQFTLDYTPFLAIGGESVVAQLVEAFYDRMDVMPEFAILRGVHGADLAEARVKLTQFLTGWLGGPQHYTERYGHPRLRARHMPFRIGTVERDQWMQCMNMAMDDAQLNADFKEWLHEQLFKTADWMRNQAT